jgi:hypothetical protein
MKTKKCDSCQHKFSSLQMLYYHVKNKVCERKKNPFPCMFCFKSYKSNRSLIKHLNAKHSDKVDKKTKNIPSQVYNELQCHVCKKIFSKKFNLKRHIKLHIEQLNKMNHGNIINPLNNDNILNNNHNINNLTNNNNNLTNNNLINNLTNNNNITNNITINNFGKEDISSISDKLMFRCINMCFEAIPTLFKIIHIDIPENRNLYLTNIKNPFIYAYANNKWSLRNSKKTLNYLQNDKKDIIEYFFENNKDKFKKHKIKNIIKMFKAYDNGELEKRYDSDLKLLLINNKKTFQNNYEKTK